MRRLRDLRFSGQGFSPNYGLGAWGSKVQAWILGFGRVGD